MPCVVWRRDARVQPDGHTKRNKLTHNRRLRAEPGGKVAKLMKDRVEVGHVQACHSKVIDVRPRNRHRVAGLDRHTRDCSHR
jgi:hypothetical protein